MALCELIVRFCRARRMSVSLLFAGVLSRQQHSLEGSGAPSAVMHFERDALLW